jgi:hypothetical protein
MAGRALKSMKEQNSSLLEHIHFPTLVLSADSTELVVYLHFGHLARAFVMHLLGELVHFQVRLRFLLQGFLLCSRQGLDYFVSAFLFASQNGGNAVPAFGDIVLFTRDKEREERSISTSLPFQERRGGKT